MTLVSLISFDALGSFAKILSNIKPTFWEISCCTPDFILVEISWPVFGLFYITRSCVQQNRLLLINSMYLRCWCSVACFNLDKLQEVTPLGVGCFKIRSYTRKYIVYWVTNYFGMSCLSMSRWMDLWLTDFMWLGSCFYSNLILITVCLSIRNTLLWKFLILITPPTYFIILDYFS